jgi:hypothetical protein
MATRGLNCGGSCSLNQDPTTWVWPADALLVDLGDGNNSFKPSPLTDAYEVSVRAGAGDDTITVGPGPRHWVYAGDGHNVIQSGATSVAPGGYLSGGDGSDEIYADNGTFDEVWCYGSDDMVVADPQDNVHADCEHVMRRPG